MIAELTSEEAVTRLLSSHEVLINPKPKDNFFGENSNETLGEFLMSVPYEFKSINPDDYKYVFIKQ